MMSTPDPRVKVCSHDLFVADFGGSGADSYAIDEIDISTDALVRVNRSNTRPAGRRGWRGHALTNRALRL